MDNYNEKEVSLTKRIFITATNTNIGKTFSSLVLLEAFSRLGLRVGVYKPIETGVLDYPLDGKTLYEKALSLNPDLHSLSLDDIVTLQLSLPAAPFVANQANAINLAQFDRALEKIETLCDIVIIEGAGGLMVPIDAQTMMIDLPKRFHAMTLLITHCTLGCINDTLLSLQALEKKSLPFLWAFNCKPEDSEFAITSLPYFEHAFETIYKISEDSDRLAKVLLDTISSTL